MYTLKSKVLSICTVIITLLSLAVAFRVMRYTIKHDEINDLRHELTELRQTIDKCQTEIARYQRENYALLRQWLKASPPP